MKQAITLVYWLIWIAGSVYNYFVKQCTGSLQGCEHTMENKEGDIGIFGFVVLAIFFGWFFGLCA